MDPTPSAQSAASFFYYTPDPQPRPKHHGHFLPHPSHAAAAAAAALASTTQGQLLASTTVSSAPFPSQLAFGPANSRSLAPSLTITPSASPSLLKGRSPSEITMPDTPRLSIDSAASEMLFTPATPTLSFSSTNTPPMSHSLLTPIGEHGWSLEESGCGTISPMEIQLPGTVIDWRASSPEAPIYAQPVIVPSNASPAPSAMVTSNSHPGSAAMSPSTSQNPSAEPSYCDPRQITYPSPIAVETEFGMEFPTMPTLCGADDEHRLLLGNELMTLKTEDKGFKAYGLDFMDELSELDSEDDFINGLTSMADLSPTMLGDNQDKLAVFDESEACLSDDDSDQLLSPPMSTTTSRQGSETPAGVTEMRPKKKMQKKKADDDEDEDDEMSEGDRLQSFKFGSGSTEGRNTSGRAAASNVIRRGRKQSLTEDPTKTFVCHLCGRRFRRQEHLKRHFRSLHTEDKPFSCGECGKKFSRSDNLTQHARIHGSGAILLGVLDENEMIDRQYGLSDQDTQPLGIVVVDALQAASGSNAKDSKMSEEKRNRRNKRKRADE